MKHVVIIGFISIAAIVNAQRKMTDCLKPWQKPIMTVATISHPSVPTKCHPESDPCPSLNPTVECQFSFKSFMYVCCEDRADVRPPVCPKFHDTLNTFCGGVTRASCPNGYKCLRSRHDPNIELCCRPNPTKHHPEPATSFLDHFITPQLIPTPPAKLISVTFKETNLTTGQLIPNEEVGEVLKDPPQLSGLQLNSDKLYTVLLFDISTDEPATVMWFAPDVPVIGGQLSLGEKKRTGLSYIRPSGQEQPAGTHILVIVVFEQKDQWSDKDLKKANFKGKFNVKQWIQHSSDVIESTPVAGNLYGFVSMAEAEESESSK